MHDALLGYLMIILQKILKWMTVKIIDYYLRLRIFIEDQVKSVPTPLIVKI